jgi:gliding motility-associated lipoprotein GldD
MLILKMNVRFRNEFRSCYKRRKGLWVYDYVSKMKATIYLTYKPVIISMSCCETLKIDIRARYKSDDILKALFKSAKKVYGMFYQVDGNAATNSQFYATDSTKHFVTGSVYFMQSPILILLCLRPVILK